MSNEDILAYNNGKKFDVILSNPPYNNGLHEKFLLKYLDIANIIVSIQPANFIFGNRKNKNIIEKLKNSYCNIETIENKVKTFNAAIGNDLSIFNINQYQKAKLLINGKKSDINNLSKFVLDNLLIEFNDIIKEDYSNDNIVNHLKKYNNEHNNNYYVKIPKIRGHKYDGVSDDFYTLISNNKEFVNNETIGQLNNVINGRSKFDYYLEFKDKRTALNFINYCYTDFFRTCFYLLKNSPNVISGRILRYVPWFDFSNPIFSKSPREIDDYLFKKYKISNEIRKHIEEILPDYYGNGKKFDVILSNPPYDKNLHLKFLEKYLEIGNTVVSIQPVRWLQDPLAESKQTSDFNKYFNSIIKHIKFLEILPQKYTDNLFGIQFNVPIAIFECDKNGGFDYNSIRNIKHYNLWKKVMEKSSPIPNISFYKNSKKDNFVPVCLLSGHITIDENGACVDFRRPRYKYFIHNKCQNKKYFGQTPEQCKAYNLKTFDYVNIVEFNTPEETKNFYNYISLNFFRYFVRKNSSDGHLHYKTFPYVNDYTKEWTDEDLYKYFNLTKDEIEQIKTFKDYYTIDDNN